MKVLYFERETTGHRISHLSSIINGSDNECVAIVPEVIPSLNCKQYVYYHKEGKKRKLSIFLAMLKEVKKICDEENPDIVHFTDGNIFYRFFGAGLSMFKKQKIILTNHNAEEGFFHMISTKIISSKVDMVVVTCEYSEEVFRRYGARNVRNIEYPHFNDLRFSTEEARRFFHIPECVPVISCVGGTRYDKGIDIILDALKKVNKPFHLLIAGKDEYFTEAFIDTNITKYMEHVTKYLKFLTDEEFAKAIECSDFVAVPYRNGFNGASGPLGEGVWRNKCIIGPDTQNLGQIILKHHLGYVFKTEDSDSLANLLNNILDSSFMCDEQYMDYKKLLDHKEFEKQYYALYEQVLK